jgi:hypothetical protein
MARYEVELRNAPFISRHHMAALGIFPACVVEKPYPWYLQAALWS